MKKDNKNTIKVSKEEAEQMMLKYMEDRYKEDFEVISFGGESFSAPYSSMIVKPVKFPDRRIEVIMYSNGEINDTYVGYYMKEKIEKLLYEISADIYPESKIFYTVGGYPLGNNVHPDMTVAEFSKSKPTHISFNIFVYDDNKNKMEKAEQLRNRLEENEIYSKGQIFYMNKGMLEKIEEKTWDNTLNHPGAVEYSKLRCRFNLNRDYSFRWIEWEDINE